MSKNYGIMQNLASGKIVTIVVYEIVWGKSIFPKNLVICSQRFYCQWPSTWNEVSDTDFWCTGISALLAATFTLLYHIHEINQTTIYKYAMHTFHIRICASFISSQVIGHWQYDATTFPNCPNYFYFTGKFSRISNVRASVTNQLSSRRNRCRCSVPRTYGQIPSVTIRNWEGCELSVGFFF